MFTQSDGEIIYTADRWRGAATGSLCLFLALPFMAPVALSLYFDGLRTFNAPLGALLFGAMLLVIGGAFVALSIPIGFRKISQPDRMVISTEGLTYSRSGIMRHYPWSRLGDLIYVGSSKGSGFYRMDVADERKPLRIMPNNFGSYSLEIRDVIGAARQGRLIEVAELHSKLGKDERQLALAFLPLMGILFATILGVIFFGHKTIHGTKAHSHLSSHP